MKNYIMFFVNRKNSEINLKKLKKIKKIVFNFFQYVYK